MDKPGDSWKKYPLLVWGELPHALPGAERYAPGLDVNNYYVVLAVPAPEVLGALTALADRGLPPEQTLLCLPAEVPFTHPRLSLLGLLDLVPGESPEEFRARVLARLECQRQKKLLAAWESAQHRELPRALPEAELSRALDTTRIAHALACGYGLGPAAHSRVLAACLSATPLAPGAWAGELPVEQLVAEAAALIFTGAGRGRNFCDHLRERAAQLPFRQRTELLHHVETTLALLAGGKHHAA